MECRCGSRYYDNCCYGTHPIEFVVEAAGVADRVSILCSSPEYRLCRATVTALVVHTLDSRLLGRRGRGEEVRAHCRLALQYMCVHPPVRFTYSGKGVKLYGIWIRCRMR